MPIILLILQIISAIPTVIKIVREIIQLIHGLPKGMQEDAAKELKGILESPANTKRLQRLQDFKDRMRMIKKV